MMVSSLLLCLATAATAFAADVTFLSPSNAVPITQIYPDPSLLVYYDTIKPVNAALLYVNSQSATIPIEYPPPGTPFTFIPTRSVWMNYTEQANIATRFHYGHVALASDPTLHLTVNVTALSSTAAKSAIPYLQRIYVLDDVKQAEQFWSYDSQTSILSFLGAPRPVVSSAAGLYGVTLPTASPELVHVVPGSTKTGKFYMNGLIVNECTSTVCPA